MPALRPPASTMPGNWYWFQWPAPQSLTPAAAQTRRQDGAGALWR